MVKNNTDNHENQFTRFCCHVDTTTGISAYERSITAMKVVEEDARAEGFRRPGHMFLWYQGKGIYKRNGAYGSNGLICTSGQG